MSAYEITISCGLCSERHKATIDLPDGWAGTYGGADDEHGLCPKHAAVAAFKDAQCPGCVGGWGDCGLWDAFAYSTPPRNARPLTENDFGLLRCGRCPRRVNGTMTAYRPERGPPRIEDLDLSTPEAEGGRALADAIVEYQNTYHTKQD
jgi:hypothetical protein